MIKLLILGVIGVALMIGGTVSSLPSASPVLVTTVIASDETSATAADAVLALAAVGINAEALAVAGLDGTGTTSLLAQLAGAPSEIISVRSAYSRVLSAKAALQGQTHRSGHRTGAVDAAVVPSVPDESAVSVAEAALAWQSEREVFMVMLEELVTGIAGASAAMSLRQIAEQSGSGVPMEYRILDLDAAQFDAIRRAIKDRESGSAAPGPQADFLLATEAQQTFEAARLRKSELMQAVSSAIQASLERDFPQSD